jgi:putative ABC transport system ATP-binding protein
MRPPSLLELDAVAKRYRDGEELVSAVDGVSLEVEEGELVALYGPSGSGKTSLLLAAAGLLEPDGGSVRYLGRDLAGLSAGELALHLRREVGFVYQSVQLMSGVPAIENAAVKLLAGGLSLPAARGCAQVWLELLGMGHRLDYVPERLSGGERQRVAIARALVTEPRLVLADEPTGNLDSQRGREILDVLSQLARDRGVGVLLATHDPQAARVAHRCYWLRDGRLLEQGEAGEPSRSPANLA